MMIKGFYMRMGIGLTLALLLISFAEANVYFYEDLEYGTFAIYEYDLTEEQKQEVLDVWYTENLTTEYNGWTKVYFNVTYPSELVTLSNKFLTGVEVIYTEVNGSAETIVNVDGVVSANEYYTKSQVPNPEKNYRSKMTTFVAEGTLYIKEMHYAFVQSILGKGYLKTEKRISFLEGLNAELNEDLSTLEKEHEALWKMACKNIPEITNKPKCEVYL